MTQDTAKLEQALLDWIADWNEGEFTGEIDRDTDLFTTGVLDSMGFTGLVAYLEDEGGIIFDFEHADSIEVLTVHQLLEYCFGPEPAQL